MTDQPVPAISVTDLESLLAGTHEFALLDVREVGTIRDEGTLLTATSLLLGDLEIRIGTLVPRLSTRIVLIDGEGRADGLAAEVARRLARLRYSDVVLLDGGVAAWRAAGKKLFPSPFVIGQSFGEFVEASYDTPRISADDLRQRIARGDDIVILDSRTPDEYWRHSLPGGLSCPGGELALRAREMVDNPDTLVVVNCAGRTRSIMGAQILVNAGFSNPVVALENGTMGWRLADQPLDHGARHHIRPVTGVSEAARQGQARIVERFAISVIDATTFDLFLGERETRTLFALDVRTPAEFVAGHHPEARSLPSWLAAPWLTFHVATHNARIVLLDDADAVRATATASWLLQMGWQDVHILPGPWRAVVAGVKEEGVTLPAIPALDGAFLQDLLAHHGAVVLDVGNSARFEKVHVEDALWASRSQLGEVARTIPGDGLVVVTSHDDRVSAFAAQDVATLTGRPVAILRGGTARWLAEDRPVASGTDGQLATPKDVFLSPWRDGENGFSAFREYLEWEKALVEEIKEDDTLKFKSFK